MGARRPKSAALKSKRRTPRKKTVSDLTARPSDAETLRGGGRGGSASKIQN